MNAPDGKKRILVVDDERDIVEIVQELLKDKGYHTVSAYDGREAIEAIERCRPDAIVLDLKMPVVDGVGVIQYLRSKSSLAGTPVIVLTATQVIQEAREKFRQLGVYSWISKPFEPDVLCATVARAVGGD